METKKQYFFIILFSMLLMIFSLWLNLSATNIDKWEKQTCVYRTKIAEEYKINNQTNKEEVATIYDEPQIKHKLIKLSPLYTIITTLFFSIILAYFVIFTKPFISAFINSILTIMAYPLFCLCLSFANLYIKMIIPTCFLVFAMLISLLLRIE